jgi:hypothetical protein
VTKQQFVAIFTGPPGCGKSTLAERASLTSGAPVANWDSLMSGLRVFPDVWAPIEADAERRRDVGYSLMCRIGEQQLGRGQSIIYDCITRPAPPSSFGRSQHDTTQGSLSSSASVQISQCTRRASSA